MDTNKVFYTLCTDGKYPNWYPKRLAKSLEPYGWRLICLVDRPDKIFDKADNLSCVDVRLFIPQNMSFYFNKWWYKMLFFQSDVFNYPLLYIDIDSTFLKNPDEILAWVNDNPQHKFFTVTDWIQDNVLATPLMYINNQEGMLNCLWDYFYSLQEVPNKYNRYGYGDQNFIDEHLKEFYGELANAIWCRFPKHFMNSYKALFDLRWNKFPSSKYGICPTKYVTMTFNGRPNIEEVIRGKMTGHQLIKENVWLPKDQLQSV